MSIEKRYLKELRASNGAGDQMILEGYAARFNSPSKDLGGFRETIAPGAFKRSLAQNDDGFCLFNHSADKVLGRSSSGTLVVSEDDKGLHFRCQLDPNQQWHRDLHSAVKRGDLRECSFAFTPNGADGEDWQNIKDERGNWFISRTLKDVNLFDASVVSHPAYDNTNVSARADVLTPEVRSHISETLQKRAGMLGTTEKRDKSVQDMLNCIAKCLTEQYPSQPSSDGQPCCYSNSMYWICDTYDNYVIASKDCAGPAEYYKITYVQKPDGEGYVFGEPTPVEKEWVPSERAKSVTGEMRAAKDMHMQAIADAHKEQAAMHTSTADAHSQAAAAHQATADATEAAIEAKRQYRKDNGLMDEEEWEENVMCERSKVYGYEADDDNDGDSYDDCDGDDDNMRSLKKTRREQRAAGMVLTKTVSGSSLPKSAFAFVGDAKDTSTWKLPVHDKAHADNAAARLNQTSGIPDDKKAAVESKIKSAQKKFGENPDDRAFREEMELRFRLSMAL